MSGTLKAFIQKGGVGTWLALPAGKNDFLKAMNEIGTASPDDLTIGQYKTDLAALTKELLMSADLDHVNYLAARLAEMDSGELDKLDAIMQSPFRFSTVEQLLDYTYNTDYFLLRFGINDNMELGRYYVYDTGLCQMPEEWKGGIDLEKFGAHAAQQERGVFTSKGYLMPSGDEWQDRPAGQGIPDEYRLQKNIEK